MANSENSFELLKTMSTADRACQLEKIQDLYGAEESGIVKRPSGCHEWTHTMFGKSRGQRKRGRCVCNLSQTQISNVNVPMHRLLHTNCCLIPIDW